jgi:hypothetical protein
MRTAHQLREQAAQLRSRAASFMRFQYYASAHKLNQRADWLEERALQAEHHEAEQRCRAPS